MHTLAFEDFEVRGTTTLLCTLTTESGTFSWEEEMCLDPEDNSLLLARMRELESMTLEELMEEMS